jgi:hypothetical protein
MNKPMLYDDLEETASFQKGATGIPNTLFISPKGNARHAPQIKVAIDPPDSVDPRSENATIDFDGNVVARRIAPDLLRQVRQFIAVNRDVLESYWKYEIDTDQLRRRLRKAPKP